MSRKHQTLRYHLPGLGTQSVNNCLRLEAIKRQLDPKPTFTDLKFKMLNLVQDSRGFSSRKCLESQSTQVLKEGRGFYTKQNQMKSKTSRSRGGLRTNKTNKTNKQAKQNQMKNKTWISRSRVGLRRRQPTLLRISEEGSASFSITIC